MKRQLDGAIESFVAKKKAALEKKAANVAATRATLKEWFYDVFPKAFEEELAQVDVNAPSPSAPTLYVMLTLPEHLRHLWAKTPHTIANFFSEILLDDNTFGLSQVPDEDDKTTVKGRHWWGFKVSQLLTVYTTIPKSSLEDRDPGPGNSILFRVEATFFDKLWAPVVQ